MVKAVVYDLGGVIISYRGHGDVWQKMADEIQLSREVVHKEATGVDFSNWLGPDRSLFLGTLTVDEIEEGLFLEYLSQKYGCKKSISNKPYSELLRGKPALNDKIHASIETLHNAGFRTGMLTNNMYLDKEHREQRIPIALDHFDTVVESCIERKMKPDAAFYRIMEERIGFSGSDIVFLDDLQENLEAAQKLGWNTIQVLEGREDEALAQLSAITEVKL